MKRALVLILLAGMATLLPQGVGTTNAAPAAAEPTDSVRKFVSAQTGRCLDGNATEPTLGAIYTNRCGAGNRYQQWIWPGPLGTTGTIESVGTYFCLDSNSAGNTYGKPCGTTANPYQRWYVDYSPNSSLVRIQNQATGRCLANPSGSTVRTEVCDYRVARQRWRILARDYES